MNKWEHNIRPWGDYVVLEDAVSHKVKRIVVKPHRRLSYQDHLKRSEVWTIVSGVGRITLDGEVNDYKSDQVIQIPQGMKHRIENPSTEEDCVFVEVQLGSYFGEDDIVRIEDDYNRT